MSTIQDTWTKASATLGAFSPFYQEDMFRMARDHNAPNNWFTLTQVRSSEPNPFCTADLQAANPYTSPDRQHQQLAALAEAGVLNEVEEGHYCLTESGRAIVDGFYNMAHENLKALQPLTAEELDNLAGLLGRIITAADNAPKPASKPNYRFSRWTDPGSDVPSVVLIDQYVTDLLRYREDAHLGAWQHHNVSGPAWEALTTLWQQDDVNTSDALAERLNRGYTAEDYTAALNELTNQGWAKAVNGHFKITEKGKSVRDTAEAETDHLFYQSWETLSDAEVDRLDDLLGRLNNNLNEKALVGMWPLANSVSAVINPIVRDKITPAFNEIFGDNARFFFVTLQTLGNAPEPFTAEEFVVRNPYVNIERPRQMLKEAAQAGYLNDLGDGGFTITDKGKKDIEAINDVFYGSLGEVQTLSDNTLEQLEGLLGKLVNASLEAEKPANKSPLVISHNSVTHPDAAPLAQIDQHLDDLNAFRDACHVPAWRSERNILGRTWETFAFVINGQANTAAALVEALPNRGYSQDEYAASLAELVGLGWIETGPDGYQATDKGRKVHQSAEDKTNEYFYAPWSVLGNNEPNQLRVGLMRLKVNLEALAPPPA
ncbi:MAG: hypothetical protein WAM60_26810 [Candidatus Promineifilaceae bacterium]